MSSAFNVDISIDELHDCIKRLKRSKSPGIDGVLAEMITDGGDLLETRLLWLFNELHAACQSFP